MVGTGGSEVVLNGLQHTVLGNVMIEVRVDYFKDEYKTMSTSC